MSEPEITRLREDLQTMRQAVGADLPFNHSDVLIMTPVACIAGAVVAGMGWWVSWEHRWVAIFPVAVILGTWAYLTRSAHNRRAAEPARWREARYGLWLTFLLMPLLIGFCAWEVALGMSRAAVFGSATFFLGLGMVWFAAIDYRRRYYAGGALPLMVFGMAMPFLDPQLTRIGVGFMLIAIALLTAAIELWQLRDQRRNADAD